MSEVLVRINEIGIERFVHNPNGPVARDLLRRGKQVRDIAYANVSGDILNVQTGNLRDNLEYLLEPSQDGITVIIGTTAINPETQFGYPQFLDREPPRGQSRRWLRDALRDGYR